MLKRMSLSLKLAAMVVVPVAALVLFAAMDLNRRLNVSQEMALLDELNRLAMAANRVAGALHDERSLTAGSLTATDSGSSELEAQYAESDKLIEAFEISASSIDPDVLGEDLMALVEPAVESLGELTPHRQQVVSGELSTAAAVSVYNDLARLLLPIVTNVSQKSSNVEVKTMFTALDLLARIKESADLERAALNLAFSSDMISSGLLQAVVEMIARQETLEQIFLAHAPPELAAAYEEQVVGETLEEVASIRLEAMQGVEADSLGISPRQWWRVSSVRIEAMAKVERQLADLIMSRVEELRASARRAAVIGVFLVLISIGGAVGLSTVVGRGVNGSLTRASETIREAVSQISSSVQQLTASTGETAAAVSQTSTTVDELRQTSEGAAGKAQATSESAEQSRGASENAQHAAERGMAAMQSIRDEVESIAERIVDLSEKNAQISDIVQNVNAIAEQSNLLAVNASIEAAKAGEHGRGFAVVAGEVKTLAERSKDATDQIRAILSEIQHSSNAAVMVTEQGVKRTDEGNNVITELGEGIQSLAVTILESSEASQQISLISSQQLAGIQQITEALKSVEQAASDNAAGAEQLGTAAEQLAAVSVQINRIVQGESAAADGR
jgi:methyl-accepting chemotaxis protein